VSFVNPHDISDFPYSYGLAGSSSEFPAFPTESTGLGYLPPPTAGYNCSSCTDVFSIPPITIGSANFINSVPGGWNGGSADDPYYQPYLVSGQPSGKPGLQAF